MHGLIESVFGKAFQDLGLQAQHDAAVLEFEGQRLAFTTDSFVVRPLFFPGGDIGTLAVCGTVNDLAMAGAEPKALSTAFILEEGLAVDVLRKVVASMAAAAGLARVSLVTGDTKVVERGKGDGLYVNTAGIGVVRSPGAIHPGRVQPGDTVIVSGDLGRHGIAVMSAREGFDFKTPVESDVAPLWDPVRALLEAGVDIHCLRDLTRGGLAGALNEIAGSRGATVEIQESAIPVPEGVRGACEILGLDPLYVPNEGRFVAFVPEKDADRALHALRRETVSAGAARIGRVGSLGRSRLVMTTVLGTRRIVDMLSGEQLPRIC